MDGSTAVSSGTVETPMLVETCSMHTSDAEEILTFTNDF
jgi:hypothetical protein